MPKNAKSRKPRPDTTAEESQDGLTPEQLRIKEEIRAAWTEEERNKKFVGHRSEPYTIPTVRAGEIGESRTRRTGGFSE